MCKFLGDAFTLDGKEGGLNVEKMHEVIKKEKPIMNILLMGAIGVGKSSLINGLFGQEVAKAGKRSPKQAQENPSLITLKSMLMEKRA